ncbi:hypothetical protein C8Q73DRAFT_776714 [Cubamyces lactineus]|nr:hypothetical protein C8Q73DRAFT_776714 [Cubamyces lactineus]
MSAPPASAGSMLLRIDDTSTRIQYEGQWSENGNAQDYDNTSHISTSAGASAKFVFNGTFITVYGSVFQNGSSSSYKLDDAPPVTTIVQQVPSTQNNWPFYYPTTPLKPGLHELVITVLGGTYSLDYIDFTSVSGEENNDNGNDAAEVPTSAASSATPSRTASPDSGSQSTTSSKGLPTAAIAGIAVAAALVVLAVALALFYVRRRSARKVRHQSRLPEKGIDILVDVAGPPKEPDPNRRSIFRRLSRIHRPAPPKSAQSSKTATSSAPTSITQSSAMFTSVIMLSPALSMVSEEPSQLEGSSRMAS